jgi:hypothetical protein
MATPKKIIITSKKNLQSKYGNDFSVIDKLLKELVTADRKRNLDTQIVYIDDVASAKKAGVTAVTSVTRQSSKKAVDDVYKKSLPAYLVIFGSHDIIPFQELTNTVPFDPRNDNDEIVPSDLPYACDAGYSKKIASFTGPSRVVGRIPDITGKADINYVKIVINTIISYKSMKEEEFLDYFSVSASVWQKSTQQSLSSIFGNNTKLKNCPPSTISYPKPDLKSLIHFYNCHGSRIDSKFYGQKGNSYPTAMESTDLKGKITYGTIVAAECCYGAELYDPANEGNRQLPVSNTYFENEAIAFVGSSTIAYGPPTGQGLADLITQYFIKNVLAGASLGRAFLDARQKYLSISSPLDPYELKTLAQFYLLGDPSLQPVIKVEADSGEDSVDNRRMKLNKKGTDLFAIVETSERVAIPKMKGKKKTNADQMKEVLKEVGFSGEEEEFLFEVKSKSSKGATFAKSITGSDTVTFRAFIPKSKEVKENFNVFEVLVLKENGDKLLGWRLYQRK